MAGTITRDRFLNRAQQAGIETITLSPLLGDLDDDLVALGPEALLANLRVQLAPDDVERFAGVLAKSCHSSKRVRPYHVPEMRLPS